MIRRINIDAFQQSPGLAPVADVRAPAEFAQGHMPGAFPLPLFSDEDARG